MNYPISVFLDTNIFIKCKYSTGPNSSLGRLLRYVQDNKVHLYISNISKREIESHLKSDAAKAVSAYKKAFKESKKHVADYELQQTALSCMANIPSVEEIQQQLLDRFHAFLSNCGVSVLDNSDVCIDTILDDYFAQKPPFEDRAIKKSEFPDAFMAAKLKQVFSNGSPLWVVSEDAGFRNSFKSHPNIHGLEKLSELFDLITKNDQILYQKIEEFIRGEAQKSSILDQVQTYLDSICIEVDGMSYDRKGVGEGYDYSETEIVDISNLKFAFDSVNEVAGSTAVVGLRCKADFYAVCHFDDYSEGIWDSEDHEYVFVPEYTFHEEHRAPFDCELVLQITQNDQDFSFEIESVKSTDSDLQLNAGTRISRTLYDPHSEEDGQAEQMDALEEFYRH